MVTRDLAEFSWHTGGAVRALAAGERCPALFRDLGPEAMSRLLRGELPRLAGPRSPVTYARTAAYVEPYTDHEDFGRVVLLPWGAWRPWHAGVDGVYVTDADARFDPTCMGVAPEGELARLAAESSELARVEEVAELLGRHHGEWREALAGRLATFAREFAAVEASMTPLRRAFQASDEGERARARDWMAARALTEEDLCAPWHHLPRGRRAFVVDALGPGLPWT